MNTNQAALQDSQVQLVCEDVVAELSEYEIALVAGGTAIVNTI